MSKVTRDDLAAMRRETMGCWWSSSAYPKAHPDWVGIAGELEANIRGEESYFEARGRDFARLGKLHRLLSLARAQAGDFALLPAPRVDAAYVDFANSLDRH